MLVYPRFVDLSLSLSRSSISTLVLLRFITTSMPVSLLDTFVSATVCVFVSSPVFCLFVDCLFVTRLFFVSRAFLLLFLSFFFPPRVRPGRHVASEPSLSICTLLLFVLFHCNALGTPRRATRMQCDFWLRVCQGWCRRWLIGKRWLNLRSVGLVLLIPSPL